MSEFFFCKNYFFSNTNLLYGKFCKRRRKNARNLISKNIINNWDEFTRSFFQCLLISNIMCYSLLLCTVLTAWYLWPKSDGSFSAPLFSPSMISWFTKEYGRTLEGLKAVKTHFFKTSPMSPLKLTLSELLKWWLYCRSTHWYSKQIFTKFRYLLLFPDPMLIFLLHILQQLKGYEIF